MWQVVVDKYAQEAPAALMTRLALDQALSASWIDEVFATHRQRQYRRELLFSSVVELMMLVALGLHPSLHAAARKMADRLPVSLAALYAKVKRTEPAVLRALVRGSAQRLAPLAAGVQGPASLPGWQIRILDGNHLPASDKRLAALRGQRGAALPGHTVVVYDPDRALVCDLVPCEDAYASERLGAAALIDGAQPGEVWIGDRNFCTDTLLRGLHARGARFLVREPVTHPRLHATGPWSAPVRTATGTVREQAITVTARAADPSPMPPWRRIEITLDTPTTGGETRLAVWSNLPADIDATTMAQLYRTRWRIERFFGRLEAVLHSEVTTLGHPRAALFAFTVAVLAYNVLALLKAVTEHAHRETHPTLDVSTYHLAVEITSSYSAMVRLLPPDYLPVADPDPQQTLHRLLTLARRLSPKQFVTSKRGPKTKRAPPRYVSRAEARAHVSTARVLKEAKQRR